MPILLTNRQTDVKGPDRYFCLSVPSVPLSVGFNLPIMPAPNRIAEIRKAKDVKIEDLAEKTGLSVSYLSRMATGGRNVSIKNLEKIATAEPAGAREPNRRNAGRRRGRRVSRRLDRRN